MSTQLKKRLLNLFLLAGIWGTVMGQSYQLSGCIKDETGTPVEVANVLLLQAADSTYKDGMITDVQGKFLLKEPQGDYILRINLMGYETLFHRVKLTQDMQLGDLLLKNSTVVMDGVTVTAAKPVIKREIDRVVFDAGNSLASVGGSAFDLLRDVPGLNVGQNSIEIIGKGGVKVYINDRETKLSGEELINFLRSYSAGQVGKVEVITTPPSRYDAEGNAGILNIRLKERVKDHMGGSVSTSYMLSERNQYGYSTANLQFNQGRISAYLNGSMVYGHAGYVERNSRFYTDQTWNNRSVSRQSLSSVYTNGGLDMELDRQWSMGVQVNYSRNAPETEMNNRTEAFALQTARADSSMIGSQNSGLTNDRWTANFHVDKSWGDTGRKMIWDVDYLRDKSDSYALFGSMTQDANEQRIPESDFNYDKNQWRKVDVVSSALDFILPFEGYSLTAGAKASYTNTRNRLVYNNSSVTFTQNDNFQYKEQIYALYADYNRNFGKKFSFKGGLRMEYTQTTGISASEQSTDKHDYLRLFPTVYLQYKPNEDHSLNASFSNRIARPAQNMVNPFVSYENLYSRHRGKEDLKPSYSYNAELSYTFKNNLNFTGFYSYATDVFSQLITLNEETHILSTLWENFMKNQSVGITNSYTFRFSWLQTFVQHSLIYSRATSDAPQTLPENEGWSYNASIRNTIYLNRAKTFTGTLSASYSSPGHDSVIKRGAWYGLNIGLRYNLLKDKLNLSLAASDLFTPNFKGDSYSNGLRMHFNNTFTYPSLRLGVTYNFGADIKQKSRNLSNQDVQNRL